MFFTDSNCPLAFSAEVSLESLGWKWRHIPTDSKEEEPGYRVY